MTASTALHVASMAREGLGWEDIIVKLSSILSAEDRREIKRYVLCLGSKIAQRYCT